MGGRLFPLGALVIGVALMSEVSGRCSCGAVRWSHPGPKTRNLMCHCDECRRGIASAFSAGMGLSVNDLSIEGKWQDYRYTPESSRGFCPECGTRLWFKSDLWPDEVFMNVGALGDPGIYVPDRHVVMGEKIPWIHPADGFEGFDGFSVAPGEQP